VPRQLPAPVPAFTGRHDQLAALSQVLDEPGGTAVITAIGGTAGVGNPKPGANTPNRYRTVTWRLQILDKYRPVHPAQSIG